MNRAQLVRQPTAVLEAMLDDADEDTQDLIENELDAREMAIIEEHYAPPS